MSVNTAPTFSIGTGIVTTDLGSTDTARSMVVQADGKILLAGTSNGNFAVVRYNSDGSLDTSFNADGILTTDLGSTDTGYSMTVDADGNILLAGTSNGNFALVRYTSDGTLDTSFGGGDGILTTDLGATDTGYSVTIDANGKILVAGTNGADFALVRYNSNGTLDTSFSGDGKLTTDMGGTDIGYSVTVDANGKILVAGTNGTDFGLVRYNSDGTLDTSFSGDGKVIDQFYGGYKDVAHSVTVDADGKILVAGYLASSSFDDWGIARFNSDGTLDTTFSGDGRLNLELGNGYVEKVYSLTVQSDGKILLGGDNSGDFTLVRLNSDGSLDTSFSGDGILKTNLGSTDTGYSITVDSDGKILLAGTSNNNFALVRYNSNGTLDTSMGGGASTLDGAPTYTAGSAAVVLDSNVQIIDAELNGSNYAGATLTLARHGGANVNDLFSGAGITAGAASGNVIISATTIGTYAWSNGELVITFNSSATQSLLNQALQKLAYSNDSSSVFAGSVQIDWTFNDGNSGGQGAGGALTATGSTTVTITSVNDAPVFSSLGDGITTTDFGDYDYGYAVAVQSDGKILLAGSSNNGTDSNFALARYTSAGKLDTTFSGDGKLTTDFGNNNGVYDTAYGVIVQSTGKVVVAGNNLSDFTIARYTSTGALDTTFDTDGKLTTDFGDYDKGYSLYQQANGKFIVVGDTTSDFSNYDFAVARYNANGTLDTSFSTDGKLTSGLGGEDYARSVTVDAYGRVLVAGFDGSDFLLACYGPDGSINTDFGTAGIVTTDMGSSGDQGWSVVTQGDDKILVAGASGDDFALARYNMDGSLDTTFDDDGKATLDFAGGSDAARSVVVQSNGSILVAGQAHNGTDTDIAIARFNSDGSLDTSFGTNGIIMTDLGNNDYASSISVQSNGKIVVGGYTNDGSADAFALVRYNSDGSLDTSFDTGTTLNGAPTFKHGGTAVVLDSNVAIFDAELAALGNYAGAKLTLMRSGGASADDRYSGAGLTAGAASGTVTVSSTNIGTYTWTAGKLVMTFNSNATEARVEQAMRGLSYENVGAYKSASIKIDWTFSDGNTGSQGGGGALTATGSTTVKITANTLNGTSAANTLNGSATTDVINGLAGNDTLKGNAGHDILNGGVGKDSLTGGTGKDIFLFDTLLNISTNLDTITDFKAADDTIRLDKSTFGKLTIGTLAAANFKANTTGKAADLNDYIVYETDTGKLFYDADGSGSKAAIQFATLVGKPTISAADFDIIA